MKVQALSMQMCTDGCTDMAATIQEVCPTQMKADNLRGHQEDQAALYTLNVLPPLFFMALNKALQHLPPSFLHLNQVSRC